MPYQPLRSLAALGILGCATLTLMPFGCANSVERTPLRQASGGVSSRVPEATTARLRECVETYQDQLSPSYYNVQYHVNVDADGRIVDVTTNDIPHNAPDFAAGTRVVLRDMEVPDSVLRLRREQSIGSTTGQTLVERGAIGSVTVLGAEVALEEVLAVAGGTTVLFAISIGLAVSGVKDIVDALKEIERCKQVKADCIVYCSDTTLPTRDFGWRFQKCKNECIERHQCPRDT